MKNKCRRDPLAGDGGGVGRPISGMAGMVDAKDISPLADGPVVGIHSLGYLSYSGFCVFSPTPQTPKTEHGVAERLWVQEFLTGFELGLVGVPRLQNPLIKEYTLNHH